MALSTLVLLVALCAALSHVSPAPLHDTRAAPDLLPSSLTATHSITHPATDTSPDTSSLISAITTRDVQKDAHAVTSTDTVRQTPGEGLTQTHQVTETHTRREAETQLTHAKESLKQKEEEGKKAWIETGDKSVLIAKLLRLWDAVEQRKRHADTQRETEALMTETVEEQRQDKLQFAHLDRLRRDASPPSLTLSTDPSSLSLPSRALCPYSQTTVCVPGRVPQCLPQIECLTSGLDLPACSGSSPQASANKCEPIYVQLWVEQTVSGVTGVPAGYQRVAVGCTLATPYSAGAPGNGGVSGQATPPYSNS